MSETTRMHIQNTVSEHDYTPLLVKVRVPLAQVSAYPRLIAHLVLVHDVARWLVERVDRSVPAEEQKQVLRCAYPMDITCPWGPKPLRSGFGCARGIRTRSAQECEKATADLFNFAALRST